MTRRLLSTTAILIFSLSLIFAQAPGWTEFATRISKYPDAEFLLGYNSDKNRTGSDPAELLDRLSGYARNQLVENIVVEIKSISMLNIHNLNETTHEEFKKMSVSFSKASISGLKTESYYDTKENIGYAFVYARKSDVIKNYENQVASLVGQINLSFDLAADQLTNGDNQSAMKSLFQIQTLIKEAENAQTLLVTITQNFNLPSIKRDETNAAALRVENELNKIRTTEQFSLDDAAFYIAFALKAQTEEMGMPIRVSNFTYQDTPMSSAFSRRLQTALSQKLSEQGMKVISEATGSQSLILQGTYWEENNRVKVSAILRDQETSAAVGSVDSYIPKMSLTASGISYVPENYKQALVSMQEFAKDEIKGGELTLDVYTNKGSENLIYTEGEILKLFVRANRECYIRFVYYLADGSKVLLLDNYFINRDNVNQTYELPYEFECATPFGVETLQVNAQGTRFDPLRIREEYGYKFILDDRQQIIANTRGFKQAKSTQNVRAERRLVFTTMSN